MIAPRVRTVSRVTQFWRSLSLAQCDGRTSDVFPSAFPRKRISTASLGWPSEKDASERIPNVLKGRLLLGGPGADGGAGQAR